jgi:uroporphyrinogen decarboxylase
MISGTENFRRAIEFSSPEYLPLRVGCNPDNLYEKDPGKIRRIRELQALIPDDFLNWLGLWKKESEPTPVEGGTSWRDEWGVGWVAKGLGHFADKHPLQEDFGLLETYRFPDPLRPDRFEEDDRKLKDRGDRYVEAHVWFTVFERYWLLRGFQNALTDPYLESRRFSRLQGRIMEIDLALIDLWIQRKADAIFFSDDWGSQEELLMDPRDWRRYYRPVYAKLFQRVRDGGAHVWMHSCGNVSAIIPDLIDMGLNVLHPVQPQAMDVDALAKEYGGKVCFCGGADVQGTLIRGTPAEIKAEIHHLIEIFGSFGGGYIGATSQSIMRETPLSNVIALYEAFTAYL